VLLALLVEVGERLPAELGVLLEVEVGAVGDAHQLAPADREAVLHVGGAFGVVGQLVPRVLVQPQVVGLDAVAAEPREAILDPAVVPVLVGRPPLHRLVGVDEVLDLHLLELARPEDEVARGDLVGKRAVTFDNFTDPMVDCASAAIGPVSTSSQNPVGTTARHQGKQVHHPGRGGVLPRGAARTLCPDCGKGS